MRSGPQRAGAPWRLALVATGLTLAGCQPGQDATALAECPADSTPIHAVQGRDWTSPLLGKELSLTGVVTQLAADGLYIQSLEPDTDPHTSEGLFLATDATGARPEPGDVVTARGRVIERGERRDTQTALATTDPVQTCGAPRSWPVARAALPLDGRDREALESMALELEGASVVSDVYNLHEGGFRIAADGPLPQPTEVARPGREARERQAHNWDDSLFVRLAPGDQQVFAVGDELLSDAGVLGHDGKGPRLLLEGTARLRHNPLPALDPPAPGDLRLASLNVQNYFNGDGDGGGFPAPRGPESAREFRRQREGLSALLAKLDPHVLAVMELENDGFGPRSAAADLLRDLEQATGSAWAVVNPGVDRVGTDQITVGLFYRPDMVEPAGPAHRLDAAPFDLLNRTPLAQTFRLRDGERHLAVSVNHFKSKGSCPDQGRDTDQRDGQGCWNAARRAAAEALGPWVRSLAERDAGGLGIILGDLNAYRLEDPVQLLLRAGFADLTSPMGERHAYSYVYFGQSGTLDHALATPALATRVTQARILNSNAGWPRRMALQPEWLGVSDHDPVIVDLRLIQASTSD